ncbi:hypothetical protein IHE44_0006896, partial [Lamprotornis superbus]
MQMALLQLPQATHSHETLLKVTKLALGLGIPLLPKINATEGLNRHEKKAWTLGRQDCFVFPKAKSLFTR